MFIAIQARNIANEKINHKYYKMYKKYTRQIMRSISWKCGRGKTRHQFVGADNIVMHQISDELNQVGYNSEVYERQDGSYELDIKWS